MTFADPPRSTDEEVPPSVVHAPEDLSSRLQSLVRSLQASPRAFRRVLDSRFRGAESPTNTPGSPSLGRRLISRLLPAATPSSVASSGGGEESSGEPCSTSSSSAPPSSGPHNTNATGQHGDPAKSPESAGASKSTTPVQSPTAPATALHPMSVPEIVLQAPEGGSRRCGGDDGDMESGSKMGGEGPIPLRPTVLEPSKLLTLVVCGGGGGSGGSSTVVDGGGSEASVVVGVPIADGGEGGGSISVAPARKSPVTVQEWVDSLPHSGAATPVPNEASLPGALHCRSEEEEEEEEVEEIAELAGEGASVVPGDMVEDGLSLGAEAGHLYSGSVPDEIMCPRQRASGASTPPTAPASQTSRRERPGGGSSATAKRREAFAGRRNTDGGGSFQSDSHSPASHSSIDSLLESRRPDPEEMLFGLGFGGSPANSMHPGQGSQGSTSGAQRGMQSPFHFGGCGGDAGSDDEVSRIPRRFLQPSKVKGVAINDFFKYQQDLIETFESGFCGYRGLTGPSHTVPSVIVAKIMEKLREHERESSSRGSVASFGTGQVCHSPTPPTTPPFSPTANYVGSPLGDERLAHFLPQQPSPHSPIVSPVESQTTNKFSKVARNVMHRSSVLTRMSSVGGDSVMSSDDNPGIACSPTGRTSLSVLTPDNRKFLDSQGSKSPEMPRKRMIIGQRSFTFGNDGDLIEDFGPPDTPTSPTAPTKPPLVHKDSVLSSIASLTSCDSDSDTDSAPNIIRSNSSRSSHRSSMRPRSGSGGAEGIINSGPWPLGKRLSSTSLSSWEELGDGPTSGSSFVHLGQRPRFLSIDEGDDENMENDDEPRRERWLLGDDENHPLEGASGSSEFHGCALETCSNEGSSKLLGSEKTDGFIRNDSMNEGLWELELDQTEMTETEALKVVPPPVLTNSEPVLKETPNTLIQKLVEEDDESINLGSKADEKEKVTKRVSDSENRLQNEPSKGSGLEKDESHVVIVDTVSQDTQVPSDSSFSNFSSYSSTQESSLTPLSIRRGSLKRQTKVDIEEERTEQVGDVLKKAAAVLNDTCETASPTSQIEVVCHECTEQVAKATSAVTEKSVESPLAALPINEVVTVDKKGTDLNHLKEDERRKRTLSPRGRSGSAHSDSSGFLEWEPPNIKIPAMLQSPPLHPNLQTNAISEGKEWIGADNSQSTSRNGGTTVGSSGFYGVEGISSDMTRQADTMELELRAFRCEIDQAGGGESSRRESADGTGRELALGGSSWQSRDVTECGSEEGTEEEMLQVAHRELCFVREMRCCVSEGMERVMQFLGTWRKRRQFRTPRSNVMEMDKDSAHISSIMSQMTFLLKQQSQLCYEMEQLSMQRLLDGQPLCGASNRGSLPEVKGTDSFVRKKEIEKDAMVVVHEKNQGDVQKPMMPQLSSESVPINKEKHLEGMVEQNARELAELKLLLRAMLISNQSDHGQ